MTTNELTKSIVDNGGKVGSSKEMISGFVGTYREPLENTYLAGGNAHIPDKMEFFEDPLDFRRRNALAKIRYRQKHVLPVPPGIDVDRLVAAIFHGIVQ